MHFLRQSTASQSRAIGPFLDETDFKVAETALTIANTDIKLMANGGASANKNAGGGTHRVNGFYGVTFDATDTATIGELKVSVVVAGALPVFESFTVLEEAVYDAMYSTDSNAFGVSAFGTLSGTHSTTTCDLGTTAPTNDISGQTIYFIGHKLARVIDSYNTGTGVATFSPAVAVTLANADAYVVVASAPASTGAYPLVQLAAITHTSAVVPTVSTLTGHTAQTGDAFVRLGAPAGASVSADMAAVKVDTAAILVDTGTTLDARIPAALVSGRMDVSVGAMAANTLTAAAAAADFDAAVADAVWDEATAGHATAGTTGKALTDASSAGDPWSTALPGAYGAGTAGKIIGDNVNAPIATVDTVVDAIKAKTDSLTFTVANKVDTNIKSVNNVTVTGTGATGSTWGP